MRKGGYEMLEIELKRVNIYQDIIRNYINYSKQLPSLNKYNKFILFLESKIGYQINQAGYQSERLQPCLG